MSKAARIISNIVYAVGTVITATLVGIALFGPNQTVNPEAMLPFTLKEQAFTWLAFGATPMVLACMAVFRFNEIKNSVNKKRNFVLIFLPGFACSACALFVIGVVIVGMINSFIA